MPRLSGGLAGGQENAHDSKEESPPELHLLTVREVQTAGDGDHSDGGGLILRVRDASASWVFRYTSPTGKRREMGLGVVHRGNANQSGNSVSDARELAARGSQTPAARDRPNRRARRASAKRSALPRPSKPKSRTTDAHAGARRARLSRARHRAIAHREALGAVDHVARDSHSAGAVARRIATITAPALLDYAARGCSSRSPRPRCASVNGLKRSSKTRSFGATARRTRPQPPGASCAKRRPSESAATRRAAVRRRAGLHHRAARLRRHRGPLSDSRCSPRRGRTRQSAPVATSSTSSKVYGRPRRLA